jgi:hypothetical protein
LGAAAMPPSHWKECQVEAGEVCGGGVLDDDLGIGPWKAVGR